MTQAEVEAKAFDLMDPVIGRARARAIVRAVATLESVPDMVALRRFWQAPPQRSTAR
jgi:hypothetical protein